MDENNFAGPTSGQAEDGNTNELAFAQWVAAAMTEDLGSASKDASNWNNWGGGKQRQN